MSDLILFPIVLFHLVLQQLHAGPYEGLIVTSVVLQPTLAHVNYIGTNSIQKILRVRY